MLLHQTVGGERKSKTAFFCGDSPLDLKCEDDREMLRIDYAAYGNAIDIRDGDLKAAEAKSDVSECLGGGADGGGGGGGGAGGGGNTRKSGNCYAWNALRVLKER